MSSCGLTVRSISSKYARVLMLECTHTFCFLTKAEAMKNDPGCDVILTQGSLLLVHLLLAGPDHVTKWSPDGLWSV